MSESRLQELLALYRPGLDDADPQFAELINALRHDPDLRRQLAERCAVDDTIRAKLRAYAPPAELKRRLLAERKVITFSWDWFRQPQWIAAAAAVVILAGSIVFLLKFSMPGSFGAYRSDMARFVAAEYKLDMHVENHAELRQEFTRRQWPADYTVPPGLRDVPLEGGCALEWHGHKVALLCFETKSEGDVWLFVTDRAAAKGSPDATPVVKRLGKIVTASWTQDNLTYILANEATGGAIQRYY